MTAAASAAALALADAALGRAIGLRPEGAMRGRLERCLVEAAAAASADVLDFARRLTDGSAELQRLCDLVTVQETWFFREPAQFAALADHLGERCAGRAVTVWSAGCANGQEAYSLAMVLADSPVASWRVVATDISTRALARTYAGRYSERELRGLDRGLRERFLRPVAGGFEVVPRLREGVEVRRHSLTAEAPPGPPGCFDAIFCRNVLIYLQAHEVVALLSRLAEHLAPGRLLFLGSSDLAGAVVPAGFELTRHGDAFIHRRGGGTVATPAPRRSAATGAVRRRAPAPVTDLPDPRVLLAEGERAAAAGDLHAATRAFRQAAYLAPDHGAAHAALGVVLEAAGDATAAARAFTAARAALARSGAAAGEGDLEGVDRGALSTLLAARLEAGS